MHKLERTLPEPTLLKSARENGLSDWDEFPTSDKKTVRDELLMMQNFRCAYCERTLHDVSNEAENKWDGLIEHFRKKDKNFHPELTFVWENLFYSCCTGATCGRHKDNFVNDKSQYALLIDPCKENPEDFFIFDYKGEIAVRSTLSDADRERAEFTIKAFGLANPLLTQQRKELLRKYQWMKQYPDQLDKNLSAIGNEPFITAIYNYFGKRVVS